MSARSQAADMTGHVKAADTTFWTFPPALNLTFRKTYYSSYDFRNGTSHRSYAQDLILAAYQNLTYTQRIDAHPKSEGWGRSDAVVRVGDVVELDWEGVGNRTVGVKCLYCGKGVENGGIEDACEEYAVAEESSPSISPGTFPPRYSVVFPTLEFYFPLPNTTSALCTFSLYSVLGYSSGDYSVPFPVLQQQGRPHRRFNAEHPTGIEDPTIPDPTPTNSLADTNGAVDRKPDVGMIVGVVVGVLGGLVVLAVMAWFLWRKKRANARSKAVTSSASSAANQAGPRVARDGGAMAQDHAGEHANSTAQNIALRGIPAVARRPDTSASEVPPPYHEAIREGKPPDVDHERAQRYG